MEKSIILKTTKRIVAKKSNALAVIKPPTKSTLKILATKRRVKKIPVKKVGVTSASSYQKRLKVFADLSPIQMALSEILLKNKPETLYSKNTVDVLFEYYYENDHKLKQLF